MVGWSRLCTTASGTQFVFGAQDEDIRLDAQALQLLHGVLRGLRLQLAGSGEVRHIGQVNAHRIATQLPLELADGLQEGLAFDVAHGAADFRDDEIVLVLLAEVQHVALDFVRDVGDDLDGLSQIVAPAFLVNNALVDTSGGEVVVTCGLDAGKPFIVAQVQVRFLSVVRHIALSVLVGVERTGVNVDVGVELLNGDVVATGLQQFADRSGDNALS